jgi:hypothetical protein
MSTPEPSLELLWDTLTGYQRTAALKAAIEHDVFSEIAAGATTVEALAERMRAAPRGLRALLGTSSWTRFLERTGDRYALSPTAAAFLDRSSPGYVGSAVEFIASEPHRRELRAAHEAVRRGGTAVRRQDALARTRSGCSSRAAWRPSPA